MNIQCETTDLMRQNLRSHHDFINDLKSQAYTSCARVSTHIRLFKIDIPSALSSVSHLWLFKSRQIQIHRASNTLYLTNRTKRNRNRKRTETNFHQAQNLSLHFVIHIDKVQSTNDTNKALHEFPNFCFQIIFHS